MTGTLHPGIDYHIVNSLGWSDLRPLQREAIVPIRSGADCLLLAPTAGGKTEAATFPLLSRMAGEDWQGLSVLYLTPLRALLNNLHPRLETYSGWIGRRAGLWHGDTIQGQRARLLSAPPDLLLTTPESLEAMLVSTKVDHARFFSGVQAVVVDELHAFAGDDRGWHLLAVLERLQHLIGHRIQRIGLSATIGNPMQLLDWLTGAQPAPAQQVIAPGVVLPQLAPTPSSAQASHPPGDVTLDYVGSTANAAAVIAALHRGEKRLAFCDSRAQAEDLANELRKNGITTFVSHSSLSVDERRRSELAFAEARDCVVVATATLELGIDVGDLDRVIQLDAPRSVASFLQRLGRTGRRPGTTRNCLFLATRQDSLLQAAALLLLWERGYVEPVSPPLMPHHVAAQQLLALVLQEGYLGSQTWPEWWGGLPVMQRGQEIVDHFLAEGFLVADGELLSIGQNAEATFGRRHFMQLTSVFTAEPLLKVLLGRHELGSISPLSLTTTLPEGQARVLLLAGRAWRVTEVDWRGRRVYVTEDEGRGRTRWSGTPVALSYEYSQAVREVILGSTPSITLSARAMATVAQLRDEFAARVDPKALVLEALPSHTMWWTYAGLRANNALATALGRHGAETTADNYAVRILGEAPSVDEIRGLASFLEAGGLALQKIDSGSLAGLKFSEALPPEMASEVLAQRTFDISLAATTARNAIQRLDKSGTRGNVAKL